MIVFPGNGSQTNALAYSPDGRTLATGSEDCTLRLWDLASGTGRLTILAGDLSIACVAWSLDGLKVLGTDYNLTIRAWDARSGEILGMFDRLGGAEADVLDLIRDPGASRDDRAESGRIDATGWRLSGAKIYYDKSRFLMPPQDGKPERPHYMMERGFPHQMLAERITLQWPGNQEDWLIPTNARGTRSGAHLAGSGVTVKYDIGCLAAFSPDNRIMALARGSFLQLWDLDRWRHRMLEGHIKPIRTLAFSPDGRTLLSGARDGVVCLWSLADGRELERFDWEIGEVETVAFAPDGATAAAGGRKGVVVWDVDGDSGA